MINVRDSRVGKNFPFIVSGQNGNFYHDEHMRKFNAAGASRSKKK